MDLSNKSFPSKILLLGEYAVLFDNEALGIPYANYSGKLSNEKSFTGNIDGYLSFLINSQEQFSFLNYDHLSALVKNHVGYDSNIPIGYGLGSSAALTAAIYDHCKVDLSDHTELAILQNQLASMESYFHGKSSGFDPLISLLQAPIYKNQGGKVERLPHIHFYNFDVYLYDSGQKRNTKGFVPSFINAEKDSDIYQQFYTASNKAIDSIVTQQNNTLSYIKSISQFQLQHMSKMIPAHVLEIWRKGLDSDSYYMKLCGAGGGGSFLVFAEEGTLIEEFDGGLVQV